jgi:hypothetical protein
MAKAPATPAASQQADETDDEKKALFGGMTEEQRADMTDEELEGIDGDDEDEEEDENTDGDTEETDVGDTEDESEKPDGDGEDDAAPGDGDDDDKDEGADAEAADQAETDADDAGVNTADDDEEDDLDVTRSVMPNEWQLPKDAEEQVKTIGQQIVDLAEKFDAGDLSAREYHAQRETLDEQRGTLRMQINDAKKAWGKALGDWSNRTCRAFIRGHQQYNAKKNPTLNNMLDAEVRRLQINSPDPFNPRILRKAHANIQAVMGKTPEPERADKKPAKVKSKTPVVPGKKPQVPPTLARVPQDEIDDAEGGKFARLSRLSDRDPHAFEVAFMRLTPQERDEYLAGA